MSWKDDLACFGINVPETIPFEQWMASLTANPCRNTLALVGLSTLAFYVAEKNHNPKVKDIFDALVYCSTSLSVGHGNVFAQTPVGKLLGSALMTLGPSLVQQTADGPAQARQQTLQQEILLTLQQILTELQARPSLPQP